MSLSWDLLPDEVIRYICVFIRFLKFERYGLCLVFYSKSHARVRGNNNVCCKKNHVPYFLHMKLINFTFKCKTINDANSNLKLLNWKTLTRKI
jgi:hypothetical protein